MQNHPQTHVVVLLGQGKIILKANKSAIDMGERGTILTENRSLQGRQIWLFEPSHDGKMK